MPHLLSSIFHLQRNIRYLMLMFLLLGFLLTSDLLMAQTNLTLSIISTSEPDSSETEDGSAGNERPVLIGEVVTYSLVFEIAEGTSNNVNTVVSIPDGLEYIANSHSLTFTNDNGWSDTVTVSGGGSSGADVTFDFGTINNTDSDANTETIEIEFDVVVNNISTNQDSIQLTTNATLNANGSTADTSEDRIVEVIEADLTVEKQQRNSFNGSQITSGDAGDTVWYRFYITNNGDAPAYDVNFTDAFPLDYLDVIQCCITTGPTTGAVVTSNPSPGPFGFYWSEIQPGDTVSINVRFEISDTTAPGESWTNTGTVDYSSLPGTNGTGNATPGSASSDTGERNNADGEGGAVDDYEASDTTDAVTVPDVELVKQIEHPINTPVVDDPSILYGATAGTVTEYVDSTDDPNTGTSEHDADNVDLAIGEEFNYIITVTFPEGTTYDLVMIDLASPNNQTGGRQNRVIELLSAEVIHVGANLTLGGGLGGVGTTFNLVDNDGGDGDADRFQAFTGGGRNVFNNPDNVENDDDRYVIRVTARLDDEDAGQYNGGASDDHNDSNVQNRDGDLSQNKVQLQWRDQNNNQTTRNPPSNGFANNDMVEPDVDVTSTTIAGSNLQAGDTATFELTVTNNGTAPAYNLNLTDTLPDDAPNFSLTFDSVDTTNSTCDDISGFATNSSSPPNVIFSFDELGAGSSCIIRFDTTVQSVTVFGATYTNSVTLNSYDSRDNAADDDNRNYAGGSDTSDVTTINITAAKALFATSENHTSDTEDGSGGSERPIVIGEVVTFQLTTTLPEGSLDNIVVSDTLGAGLEFVDGTVTVYTNNAGSMSFADIVGSVPTTSPGLSVPTDAGGAPTDDGTYRYDSGTDTLEINLGDITNNDSDADVEEVIILFDAVAANTSSNDLGDTWTNDFSVSVDGGTPVTSNTVGVVVQEPNVSVTKTVNQTLSNPTGTTTFDGGDTVVYDIVISNTSGTNVTDAFDLNITDTLDANLSLDNVQLVGTITGTPTDNSTGTTVDVDIDQLAPGESLTIRLTTTVQATVIDGQTIDNTANLTHTSLPGTQGTGNATPGASGDADGERNGDGGTNDYADSDAASFTVGATYNAEKSIISTSESHTDDSSLPNTGATDVPVGVGELVRYQLETQMAEGTMVDFTLTDQLPIDGGTAVVVPLLDENFEVTVSGAQSGTFTSATYGTSLEAANGGTVDLFDNAGTPQFAGLVTYTSATNNLQLDFGNLTNSDGDSGTESLVVRFNALVVNVSEVNSGETYTNNYAVLSDDFGGTTQTRDTSGTVGVVVEEPNVSVTKTVNQTLSNPTGTTTFDGGDTVVYDIVISNTSGTNVTDAFDLNITDTLDANLSLDNVQLVGTITGTPTDNSTGTTVDVDIDQLAPGESLTIRLTTTVQNSITLGQVINNTANLIYTSLPGTQGTGNATPGASGDADGERNGDGGTNDYADNDNDTFTVGGNVNATKSIDGTSETHTADTAADTTGDPRPVAVGEVITYRLVTELPEVTSPDVVVTDTLAANIEYVTGSGRVSYSADSAVTGSGNYGNNETEPTTVITPTFDGGSRELVFDIGAFVNNDNDGNVEQLIIEFEALVLDDVANTPGTQWYNEYIIDLDNDSTVEDTSNQVFAQIVQPELTLTKTRTDTGLVQIGDTVNFELTLTHSVNSTSDAFNTVITDTLPTTGMGLDSVTGGSCSGVTSGSGTGILTFSVPDLALTDTSCTIQYSMVVGNDVEPNMTYTNTAVATYETIDGSNQRILTTNSDNASFTTLANDLAINKSVTPNNVEPGGTITYTIEFTHTGFTANNVVITDTLPAEVTIQNTDSSGDVVINNTVSNSTIEVFEIAQITSGQTGIITLTAQLDNNLSAGTFFTNGVVITSTEADIDTANNSASDTGVTVNNVAPILAPIGDQSIAETNTLTFTASATDNNSDTLTYGLSGEPSGASIDSGSGLFSWTPTNAQGPGVYTFTVIVSDTAPLTDSEEIAVTVIDLDIDYSVDVDPTSLIEGNTGTQPFTFTITRSGAIDFASQVDYSFGGTSTATEDYTAPAGPMSFTSGEISQTVTANVLGDWVIEPDETLSLTLFDGTAPSGGLVSYTTQSITSTIVNDDSAGINVISDTMPLTITEPAETTTFTITLTSQPTATVSIDIASTDSSECAVSTSSVDLDSGNWQTGVEVIVTAQDDDITDGTQSCDITTAPAASSDLNYDGLDPADVAVNVLDDDIPGVRVSPVSGDTSEAGDTASFTMQLQTEPTEPVTITLQSSDTGEGQIDLSEVVFTDATWNISQTVVITGIDDLMDDGDQSYIIETGNTQSDATLYNNLPVDDVMVVNLDNDTAGVEVSADELLLSEPDGSEVITITLTSQPTSTVTIDLTSSDTSVCTVDPETIEIDPVDWSEPISITVQVVDDDEPRGERTCVISGAVSSDDRVFDALPDIQIDVTVEDDESPYVYLPLIQSVSMPDLVITDLQATSDSVQVTIRNDGTAPITEGFWVDLYFNPSRVPQYNDLWQYIAEAGIVWGIANNDLPIEPGESRILTLENATQTFNGQTVSSSPPFPTNVPVYAQIDSVSATSDFGGVQESDESNNVFGPVVSTNSTTGGGSTSSTGQPVIDFLDTLPKR